MARQLSIERLPVQRLLEEACRLSEDHDIPADVVALLLKLLWYQRVTAPHLDKYLRDRLRRRAGALERALDALESEISGFNVTGSAVECSDPARERFRLLQAARELVDLVKRTGDEHGPAGPSDRGDRVRPHEIWMAYQARELWRQRRHHPDESDRPDWQDADLDPEPNAPRNAYTRWMWDVLGVAGMPNLPGENRVRTVLRHLRDSERGGR